MERKFNILPLFLSLLLLSAFSCKTVRETQMEYIYETRTDTLSQIKWRVDSVNVHDSIVTFIKGDTVQIEKWHTAYKERLRVDTVEKVRTETVFQTKTEIRIQEVNRLKWWQKALMWIGGLSFIPFFVLWCLYRYEKGKKKFSGLP